MRKIEILFMQSQTYFGADSRIHSLLMRHLDRDRFEVHVLCNVGSRYERSAAAEALAEIPELYLRPIRFGPSVNNRPRLQVARDTMVEGLPALGSLAAAARYVRQQGIDIIHCTEKPRDAFYGLLLARLTGAKCLVHLHVKAENWISPLVQWSMHRADALVGVSAFVAGSIVEMGYPAVKTSYVWNGLETGEWSANGDGDGGEIRREFSVPADVPLLLIASRLFYWKGHSELLKALATVKERGAPFRLLIVGENDPRGHPGGGSYKAELEELAQQLDLQEEVIFTGYRQDMPRLMAGCDIFTMPSFEEPFGMVYLEAMAMKKPIIALDNGGAREIIQHERTGLLSAPQDIEQLAENIHYLLREPAVRESMGERGQRRLFELFTAQQMVTGFQSVYEGLAQGQMALSLNM